MVFSLSKLWPSSKPPAEPASSSAAAMTFPAGSAVRADSAASPGAELASFAAGCFWSVELAFQRVPGVLRTAVGYTQGHTENPTYRDVCGGRTGHVEAVLVEFDPTAVSYETLLGVFWNKHDPTQKDRQGNDWGPQYRSGVYHYTAEQGEKAQASLEAQQRKLGKKIWTEVLPAATFYVAEEYHQQYLEKGGPCGRKQSSAKGCQDPIRCYG